MNIKMTKKGDNWTVSNDSAASDSSSEETEEGSLEISGTSTSSQSENSPAVIRAVNSEDNSSITNITTTTSSDNSTTASVVGLTSTTSVNDLQSIHSSRNKINPGALSVASGVQMSPHIYSNPFASNYSAVSLISQYTINMPPLALNQYSSKSNIPVCIYNDTSPAVGSYMQGRIGANQQISSGTKSDNSSNSAVNPNKRAIDSSINSSDNSDANNCQQISTQQVLATSITYTQANESSDVVIRKIKKLKTPTKTIIDVSLSSQPSKLPSQNLHQPSNSLQLFQPTPHQLFQPPPHQPFQPSLHQAYRQPYQQVYPQRFQQVYPQTSQQVCPQPSHQAYSQPSQQAYSQPSVQAYSQPSMQAYSQPSQQAYSQPSQQAYSQPSQQAYSQPSQQLHHQPPQLYLQPAPLLSSQLVTPQPPINLTAFRRLLMGPNAPVLNPSSFPSNVPLSLDEVHRMERIAFGNGSVSSSSYPPTFGQFPLMSAINNAHSSGNITAACTNNAEQNSPSHSDANSLNGSDKSRTSSQSEDDDAMSGSDESRKSQSEDYTQRGSDESRTSQSEDDDDAMSGLDGSRKPQSEDNTHRGSDESRTSQPEDDDAMSGLDGSRKSQSEDNTQGGPDESFSFNSGISRSPRKSKGSPGSSHGSNNDQNISFNSNVNDNSGQDSMMEEESSIWRIKTLIKDTIEHDSPVDVDEENVKQRDQNILNNTDSSQLPQEEESDDCVIVHSAVNENSDDVIICCTKWAHHYCGDVIKAEICYMSVVGYCKFEDIGCPKLHASQHFYWQVKSKDGLWVNLRPEQVIVLEKCFCDPNIDEVEVPILDPSTLDKSLKGLLKLLKGRQRWKAVYDSMSFVSLSDLSDSLPLRRLCTEAFVDVTSTTSEYGEVLVYTWQVKGTSKQWVYLYPEQSSVLEEAFLGSVREGIEVPAIDISMTKLNRFMKSHLTYLLGEKAWIANLDQMILVDEGNTTTLTLRRYWTENAPTGRDVLDECLYSWYFKDKRCKWIEYGFMDSTRDPDLKCKIDSEAIEKHYQESRHTKMSIQNGKFTYAIDFINMEQTNLITSVKRQIKRRPKPHLEVDSDVDKITDEFLMLWDDMKSQDRVIRVRLNPKSEEYLKIVSLFHDCWNNRPAFQATVIDIERVQNPYLWKAFKNKIQDLEKVYKEKDKVNIQLLFHGTQGDYIDNICQENFDWRLHGSNVGHVFGKGTYFSPYSNISYAYCSPRNPYINVNGTKYMFVAEVAVGQMIVGDPNMVRPPQNPYSISLYDSTVDKLPHPSIIVKYDKQEYYPKYILTLT